MRNPSCRFCLRYENGCAVHHIDESRLQGPAVGTLCVSSSRYDFLNGRVVRVAEQSYVWAPGDPSYNGGSRNYGECVIEYEPTNNFERPYKRVVVLNSSLTPVVLPQVGDFINGRGK